MIPYEDLCHALDSYNRRLRGEEVPAEEYAVEAADDYDIVETADADAGAAAVAMEGEYAEGMPDVTAETAVPDADFGDAGSDQYGEPQAYEQSDQYAQAEYDSGAVPGAPAEQYGSDQYSSGQQEAAPQQQEYDSGAVPAGTYPDDQDPNSQQ